MGARSNWRMLTVALLCGALVVGGSDRVSAQVVRPVRIAEGVEARLDVSIVMNWIKQLKSVNATERGYAALALGRASSGWQHRELVRSAIPQIIPLLQDSDAVVRSQSAEALGYAGELARSAVPQMMPLLQDSDAVVRASAAKSLGRWVSPRN